MSDLFDVSQETILVTGASQGLGRQFARVLADHGAAVALAARQADKLKSLEEEIRGKGGRAAAVALDVTDMHRSPRPWMPRKPRSVRSRC